MATARNKLSKFFWGASRPIARTIGFSATLANHSCETGSSALLRTAVTSTPFGMTIALRIVSFPSTASLRAKWGETKTSRSAKAATVLNLMILHQREKGFTGLPSIIWSRSLLIRTMVRHPERPVAARTLARWP